MITTDAKEHRANIRRTRRERGQLFDYTTAVVWEGESPADGAPIAAIVTNLKLASENRKTGDMAQVYILRTDIRPVAAVGSGLDTSTCGNCPLRPLVRVASPAAYVQRIADVHRNHRGVAVRTLAKL